MKTSSAHRLRPLRLLPLCRTLPVTVRWLRLSRRMHRCRPLRLRPSRRTLPVTLRWLRVPLSAPLPTSPPDIFMLVGILHRTDSATCSTTNLSRRTRRWDAQIAPVSPSPKTKATAELPGEHRLYSDAADTTTVLQPDSASISQPDRYRIRTRLPRLGRSLPSLEIFHPTVDMTCI